MDRTYALDLIRQIQDIPSEYTLWEQGLEALHAELEALYFKAYPRRKKKPDTATLMALPEFPSLQKERLTSFKEKLERSEADLEKLKTPLLKALNEGNLSPKGGQVEMTMETIYYSTYKSQGWGAEKYACVRADLIARTPKALGIPTEVVPGYFNEDKPAQRHPDFWKVVVKLKSEEDLWLLKYCPTEGPPELVRLCWKRGVNPRVYWPMLPHDFETKHGLDRLGNRKVTKNA